MAAKRQDRLGVVGFVSTILRNVAQQRSLAKARDAKNAPPPPRATKPKDTRTSEQIAVEVETARASLVSTMGVIRYRLDVPARSREIRDRISARMARAAHGPAAAGSVVAAILIGGFSTIAVITRFLIRHS